MSTYVIEMKVKKLLPPREDSRYDDFKTLAEFNLPAESEAFDVFQTAFVELTHPRVTLADANEELA